MIYPGLCQLQELYDVWLQLQEYPSHQLEDEVEVQTS